MKLRVIITHAVALALGLSGVAFAANYYPPERINCRLNEIGQLNCADFNRAYLTEHTHTANFPTTSATAFAFANGTAYQTNGEWTVFYTYKNAEGKNVTLKTTNIFIKPDLVEGAWKSVKNFYTCDAGYMSCPINGLLA